MIFFVLYLELSRPLCAWLYYAHGFALWLLFVCLTLTSQLMIDICMHIIRIKCYMCIICCCWEC